MYDEALYEGGHWPSVRNPDHKKSFTLRDSAAIPQSELLQLLLPKLRCDVEHMAILTVGWDPKLAKKDQTLLGAECSIEFVLKKPGKFYY